MSLDKVGRVSGPFAGQGVPEGEAAYRPGEKLKHLIERIHADKVWQATQALKEAESLQRMKNQLQFVNFTLDSELALVGLITEGKVKEAEALMPRRDW